jgi:hypothetical protein
MTPMRANIIGPPDVATRDQREEIMTKFVSFIAIATFALSASSVEAAKKKPHVAAARSAPVQTSAPVQKSYPKLENAVWLPPHQE